MPCILRVFEKGGIFHVYNRFASGEPSFADPEETVEFIEPAPVQTGDFVTTAYGEDVQMCAMFAADESGL